MFNKKYTYLYATVAAGIALSGSIYYYCHSHPSVTLIPFDYKRDFTDVMSIFDKNWHWLMPYAPEEYDPNYLPYVFENLAPHGDPARKGKLIVKVVREAEHVIAFVAYYMKTKASGFLLFLAVDNAHRGKKYGEKLARYALSQMAAQGAKQVQLITRLTNVPAQSLYKKLNFKETVREGAFVYYTYKK
jgi:GNAT superfamily N-acetyltransferase